MPPLGVDFAWAKPAPDAVRSAGYEFVIGYLSLDPAKNLTADQITAYQAAGLGALLVWETTANRALAGMSAGMDDARAASAQAQTLGYPPDVPIFFACDVDTTALIARPYFRGVTTIRPCCGAYGGINVVDPLLADGTVRYTWQTCAWSGQTVSTTAHLYQRLRPTLTLAGTFDEDVMLRPIPLWTQQTQPAPQPAQPSPALRLINGDDDMPFMIRTPDGEIDLVGGTVVHLDEPGVEFYAAQGIKEYAYRQADGDAVRKAAQA